MNDELTREKKGATESSLKLPHFALEQLDSFTLVADKVIAHANVDFVFSDPFMQRPQHASDLERN